MKYLRELIRTFKYKSKFIRLKKKEFMERLESDIENKCNELINMEK